MSAFYSYVIHITQQDFDKATLMLCASFFSTCKMGIAMHTPKAVVGISKKKNLHYLAKEEAENKCLLLLLILLLLLPLLL